MADDTWNTPRRCDDCGRPYTPSLEAAHDVDAHRAPHLAYAAYADVRCFPCHLGLPPGITDSADATSTLIP